MPNACGSIRSTKSPKSSELTPNFAAYPTIHRDSTAPSSERDSTRSSGRSADSSSYRLRRSIMLRPSWSAAFICSTSLRLHAHPGSEPHNAHAIRPLLGKPGSPGLQPSPCLSISCRSKYAFIRRAVSGLMFTPFDRSRPRATPTSVPPRPYSLRQSSPFCASARTPAGGVKSMWSYFAIGLLSAAPLRCWRVRDRLRRVIHPHVHADPRRLGGISLERVTTHEQHVGERLGVVSER